MNKIKTMSVKLGILSVFLIPFACCTSASHKTEAGRCTGSEKCKSCKTCEYCQHCSREGGTCGVCSPKRTNAPVKHKVDSTSVKKTNGKSKTR